MGWIKHSRPGYFGRRRDRILVGLTETYGVGGWKLMWDAGPECAQGPCEFETACEVFYERSYVKWFLRNPSEVDFVCSFGECIDNATSNVESGCDYMKQEAFSTHIQDIAVRNVLRVLGRKFEGLRGNLLTIRSSDSNGYKYGPGNIPFYNQSYIEQPSLRPGWANTGSTEDFWQSNKFIYVKE